MRSSTIEQHQKPYLPAAGHDWLLPAYDPLVKLLGGESARRILRDQADIRPHHRILDIGCGTGSFEVQIKCLFSGVEVVGLDPDPRALARAKAKAQRAGFFIQFDQGFSDQLPYEDRSFDRVFSSLMFHHLEALAKEKTLSEVARVLKHDGSLHLLDFGGPESSGFLGRLIHSSHQLKENAEGHILGLMRLAGFRNAQKVKDGKMFFGLIRTSYYRAAVQ